MENIQTFQIKSRDIKFKTFVTVNIFLLVLFDRFIVTSSLIFMLPCRYLLLLLFL